MAALLVVVFHYHHFFLEDFQARPTIPEVETYPYAAVLGAVYRHGAHAVELFWVISGFIFLHVYLKRKTSLRDFWVARIARLYPLHFAMLLMVAGLQALNWFAFGTWQVYGNNNLRHFLLQLVMASNWSNLSRGLSFNGPIWSVSVELAAYAVFFVSLGALRRFGLMAAAALCGASIVLSQASWFDPPLLRPYVFVCVAYFFWGCCLYYGIRASRDSLLATGSGAIGLALASSAAAVAELQAVSIAAGAAVLIVLAATLDIRKTRGQSLLRPIGDISYSLYLVHVPIQIVILTCVDLVSSGYRDFAFSYWLLPAYVIVSCGVATLAYRYFEVPAGRVIRCLKARPTPAL